MFNNQREFNALDEGANRIFVDLLFDLAAGESVKENGSYEEQIKYFVSQVIPDHADYTDFVEYGQKYKMASKYMFPGKPERIKNRNVLIKLFSNFVVLKEISDCTNLESVHDTEAISEAILDKFVLQNENDQATFLKEVQYLAKRYSEILTKETFRTFLTIMANVSNEFNDTYSKIVTFVTEEPLTVKKGSFAAVLEVYHIPQMEITKFHLVVDAIVETVVIKNQHLEYEQELKCEWEKHFPKLGYSKEIEEYAKSKKSAYIVSYGNNISSLRNENFLFNMLADVTVKLALADGAKNTYELKKKIKELTGELGNNIRDIFVESRDNVIRCYHLFVKGEYSSELRNVLIPYRTDLMYLRDIIIEEISYRNVGNIVQKQARKTKDPGEYELLLSQKDAEIYELKNELEYYENIKQQQFKAEVSQYNRALTDLFRNICDFKYDSPLNELYLISTGVKDCTPENIKGIVQNLIFILSTMNIVPYETGNVGKNVKFYDDEANIVYAVEDCKVQEGLNQGVQVYPGWKYKDTELVLPKVEIKED